MARRTLGRVIALAVLVVPLTPFTPAAGAPAPQTPPAAKSPSWMVTLVTGDVVRVQGKDGEQSASVAKDVPPLDDVRIVDTGADVYAIPGVAGPLLAAGRLDTRLFNVSLLVRDGYADDARKQLPVIVTHRGSAAAQRAATAVDGARLTRSLPSAGAAALAVDKQDGAKFWAAVTEPAKGAAPLALAPFAEKVWLDGRVRASLDVSRATVGADRAWAAGFDGAGVSVAVLDTGIDATHPDLVGKVAEARAFMPAGSGGDSPTDRYGHGTHVASIIAGSGAASSGTYAGVAPKATLYNGKVLDDSGGGLDSWIIAGMEWAASKAQIVNMSLGGGPTDGSDPVSEALNDISRRTGALFVVAAGNRYRAPRSVAAPGAADEALTVAAATRDGRAFAAFSSIGPRAGDWALKPEISAPGQGIVAARTAGSKIGTPAPGNDRYMPLSGTSMATPHVAAMAALLRQQHPQWTRQRLRDALTSTATPLPDSTSGPVPIWAQGAGEGDVGRAVTQQAHGTGVLDLGIAEYPQEPGDALSGTLTYTNDGTAPVTLELSGLSWQRYNPDWPRGTQTVEAWTPPAGAVTVEPARVTVPAGGTASATVRVAADQLPVGRVFGRLAAAAPDGTRLTTVVGASRDKESYRLNLTAIGLDGAAPAPSASAALAAGLETGALYYGTFDAVGAAHWISLSDAGGSLGLVPDTYRIVGVLGSTRLSHDVPFGGWTVPLDQPRELTVDARTASQILVQTARPTVRDRADVFVTDTTAGGIGFGWRSGAGYGLSQVRGPQPDGLQLTMFTKQVAPPLELSGGHGKARVRALPAGRVAHEGVDCPYCPQPLPSDGKLALVDAGDGSPPALAGKDLAGKVALIREAPRPGPEPDRDIDAEVTAAAKAGATGVVFAVDAGAPVRSHAWNQPVWVTVTTAAGGADLAKQFRRGSVRLDAEANLPSPYVYNVAVDEPVSADGVYRIDQRQLATVTTRYHAPYPGAWAFKWDERDYHQFGHQHWYLFSNLPLPHVETEYVSPMTGGRTELCHVSPTAATPDPCEWISALVTPPLQAGQRLSREFMAGPYVPGPVLGRPLGQVHQYPGKPLIWEPYFESAYTEREAALGSGDGHGGLLLVNWKLSKGDLYDTETVVDTRTRISRGDQVVCDQPGVLPASACWLYGAGQYEIVVDTSQRVVPTSTRTTTRWELNHDPDAGAVPLVLASYQLPTDLDNNVSARRHRVPLRVGYQPGGPAAPPSWTVTAWATFDDGRTWQPVHDRHDRTVGADGRFSPEIDPPRGHNGYVGLRVRAEDGQGNALDQTIIRAYRLKTS